MRASRVGVHVGCALGAWTNAQAFVPPSPAGKLQLVSMGLSTISHNGLRSFPNSCPLKWDGVRLHVANSVRFHTHCNIRNRWQSRLHMSSTPSQGMNPESFTERAWDAMARLPALADTHQSQVILIPQEGKYSSLNSARSNSVVHFHLP